MVISDNLMVVLQLVAQGLANNVFPKMTIAEYIISCLGGPAANELGKEIDAIYQQPLAQILGELNEEVTRKG